MHQPPDGGCSLFSLLAEISSQRTVSGAPANNRDRAL
jgi:hypothetical protein